MDPGLLARSFNPKVPPGSVRTLSRALRARHVYQSLGFHAESAHERRVTHPSNREGSVKKAAAFFAKDNE
jgi:hypothetical protein